MKNKMNKKGDIPTFALLVITIFLVIITWTTFLSSDKDLKLSSQQVSNTFGEVEFKHKYIIKIAELSLTEAIQSAKNIEEVKSKFQENVAKHNINIDGQGNFFGKISKGDFTISKEDDFYNLEIKNLSVGAQEGNNEIVRNFDINLKAGEKASST